MKTSEFAGSLPQTFINFRCLEKKYDVQERIQAVADQLSVIAPPNRVVETVEIPETDTSPVKVMAVLQSTGHGVHNGEDLTQVVIYPASSGQSSGHSDVNALCEDNVQSLNKVELRT